jgi:predicted O-methyltransferase YrrM
VNSSYAVNNYGEVFNNIVEAFQPRRCVELGVLDGYSTLALGHALKRIQGKLDAWDLFEDYPFKHGSMVEVASAVILSFLGDVVSLHQGDAFKVHEGFEDHSVDLLHVDLSNTGDTLKFIMEAWDPKMVQGGMILFEGGSEDRDRVDWMVKYNKPGIKPELETNKIIEKNYVFGTYLKYPSLTCLLKKR